ncbi:MAG: SBBP repeat-containing protein [Miltoncostaeaceae bacterium]
MTRGLHGAALAAALGAVVLLVGLGRVGPRLHEAADTAVSAGPPSSAAEEAVQPTLAQLPLYFVENRGQVDDRVAFYLQGASGLTFFTPTGVTLLLSSSESPSASPAPMAVEPASWSSRPEAAARGWAVQLDFVEANPSARVAGLERTSAVVSYFTGEPEQWQTGLPTYASVIYEDLWPGIDLVYSGEGGRLKATYHVAPGADPGRIRLAWRGADSVAVTPEGRLRVSTPLAPFEEDRPFSYQQSAAGRAEVATDFTVEAQTEAGVFISSFRVGDYDRSLPLVVDPIILAYSGFIGGSGFELAYDVAVDGSGNAYVVGHGPSTEATFPVTGGPDLTHNGQDDAFVAKVNAAGTALVYAGYIGGSGHDFGLAIAVDAAGNAYVTGQTATLDATFPLSVGPDLTFNGTSDIFVAKVNPAGTGLVYSGYVGGAAVDTPDDIAVDSTGNAYLAGSTASTEGTFPVSGGPDLTHNGGPYDCFMARINAAGTGLDYAGYIGGAADDFCRGIDVDASGNAYVAGTTESTQSTFPVLVGPDPTFNGDFDDAFVAKVDSAGTLVYSGFIGGDGSDFGRDIAVDAAGAAYVTGYTESTEATFPLAGGPDLTHNGGDDGFVTKVNPSGTGLVYSGFLGGSGADEPREIAVDASGHAHVAGFTTSTEATFPVAGGPDSTYNGGSHDAFVATVDATGTALTDSGYVGGSGADYATGIAIDGAGHAYVTGMTFSTETTFPVKGGPDLTHNGGFDAFVVKLRPRRVLLFE